MSRSYSTTFVLATLACLATSSATAQQARADGWGPDPLPAAASGDVGMAVYSTSRIVPSESGQTSVLPYAYFDYKRLFARLDTVGVKTVPLGAGWLEINARVSMDGFTPDPAALRGIERRDSSVPIGLGTLQKTPYGGIFLNAFHDVGKSGGQLYEAIWVGKWPLGRVTVYPQAGVEHRSADYVRYYYGVSAAEAAANGSVSSYTPGGATNPLAGLYADLRLNERLGLGFYLRRRWLDSSITASPLVDKRHQDTAFIAVTYKLD